MTNRSGREDFQSADAGGETSVVFLVHQCFQLLRQVKVLELKKTVQFLLKATRTTRKLRESLLNMFM